MNKKAIVSAIMAMYLSTGGLTFAQGYGDRNDRGNNQDRGRNEQVQRGGQQDRHDDRSRSNNERRDERGAGPNHNYYRGGRLPAEYRNRQYVVDDWRGHQLSAPPRGYHWVQTGGDYVLIAIASGIIAQILLGR
jgi:Ni/Co efflux regulator RcnB